MISFQFVCICGLKLPGPTYIHSAVLFIKLGVTVAPQAKQTDSASQAITHIPTAKRGEYLVMKHLGLSSGIPPPSTSAMTYDEVFNGDPAHMQALRELFPLVSDVSARKRRCRTAARA
jgi:hypothetical protein